MNSGTIAARYARALLKYALEKGNEDEIFSEVTSVLADEKERPELSEDMTRFLSLVISSGRKELLRLILDSFLTQYRKEKGIVTAKLTTADDISEDLSAKIESLLVNQGAKKVDLQTERDTSLIGGFILEVDDKRMDASVTGSLGRIRSAVEEMNSKLL